MCGIRHGLVRLCSIAFSDSVKGGFLLGVALRAGEGVSGF